MHDLLRSQFFRHETQLNEGPHAIFQQTIVNLVNVREVVAGVVLGGGAGLASGLSEVDGATVGIIDQIIFSGGDAASLLAPVLRLALQSGHSIPEVYTESAPLLSAVAADPAAVSFAWARDVQHDRRIKVLRVLWHD